MFKFLLFCGVLLLGAFASFAQAGGSSFIRLSHLGTQGRPIIDLYLATQEPALNADQGIDAFYKFQSVCLLTEAEFTPLLRYAESFSAKNKPDAKNQEYGTFELTLGPTTAPRKFIYSRTKSLAFLNEAIKILQKQAAGPDKSEALRRLESTSHRLSAPVAK